MSNSETTSLQIQEHQAHRSIRVKYIDQESNAFFKSRKQLAHTDCLYLKNSQQGLQPIIYLNILSSLPESEKLPDKDKASCSFLNFDNKTTL